jgi:zinc protease
MSLLIDRNIAPQFVPVTQVYLKQAEKKALNNGVPLYTLDAGTQELVRIEFIFNAGMRHQDRALTATAVNDMLDEGTHSRQSESIAEELDYFGAFIETETSHDHGVFTLFCLNKHLASVLPIVQDILRNAAFPEKEFGIYSVNKKQRYIVESEKVSVLSRRRFNELLFGKSHPYGMKAELSDYDLQERNDLVQFHTKQYNGNNCTIVVAGRLPDNLLPLLNDSFGDSAWMQSQTTTNTSGIILSDPQREHTIVKDGAIQSAIRLGRVLFNKHHTDFLPMQVLNTLIGGYFGSRLMANIREDKGYTYGIGSSVASMLDTGYFVISTEVGVKVTEAALKEIYHEINLLQQDLVQEEELELVRNYMTGVFLRSSDGPFALTDRLKGLLPYNLGYDYYDRYLDVVQTITPQQLRDLAQRYLKKEDLIELVAGNRA